MSTSYACSIMFGLPYKELTSLLTYEESEILDEMLYDGDLDYGSIGYDSSPRSNIVGVTLLSASSYTELNMVTFTHYKSVAAVRLADCFPSIKFKIFLTLYIT